MANARASRDAEQWAKNKGLCMLLRTLGTNFPDLLGANPPELAPADLSMRNINLSYKRATKLLGPMYAKRGARDFQRGGAHMGYSIGVRDAWQKMPGRPPYYHNKARHVSQVEPPKGWDPSGPREQVRGHLIGGHLMRGH